MSHSLYVVRVKIGDHEWSLGYEGDYAMIKLSKEVLVDELYEWLRENDLLGKKFECSDFFAHLERHEGYVFFHQPDDRDVVLPEIYSKHDHWSYKVDQVLNDAEWHGVTVQFGVGKYEISVPECYCRNCSWTGPKGEVRPYIESYDERVDDPTGVVGECPKCRCLAYSRD